MPPSRLLRGASLAALLLALEFWSGAVAAQAVSKSAATRYPLLTGNYGRMLAGRVDYGMNSRGEFGIEQCCDFNNYGTWPRGTFNRYMYNSGPQIAAVIGGSRPTNPWAGDTSAGLFFDASGLRQHGTGVTEVFNAGLAFDRDRWPQAGYVPYGSDSFAEVLQGRASASDGDLWWLAWEGDPGLNAARPHPLGVAAEFRVMGWNAPRGIEDVMVVQVTFHNITARDAAAYAHHRPGLREQLAELGERFHQLNEEKFAVDLPDGGWSLERFHASVTADPDVTFSAGINFASVNLPLAMGYAWHADFPRANYWAFPADIFSPPFFAGAGLVGMKMLGFADGPPTLRMFSTPTNGGPFRDPNSAVRAYKYFSGTLTAADSVTCNAGDPQVDRICYINAEPTDVRTMQSAGPVTLSPGESVTLVWAYVHAAPVAIPGYTHGTRVFPGDPRRLVSPAQLAVGANRIDSIAGFTGFTDRNGDGMVQGAELDAVRGSLIAKAQLAQALYDNRFLLPQPPEPPAFFLIPGDRTVTVVWRPSVTETLGDPYYQVARDAAVVPPGGGGPLPNPLYDANYRQFDVEGYRVWRSRTDRPEAMELVAQYDHDGTVFRDHTGQVLSLQRGGRCAPELDETSSCPGTFDAPGPGIQLERFVEYPLAWNPLVQVATGDRVLLPGADVFILAADTTLAGAEPGQSALRDTGVPFVHVDRDVQNGLTYFYAVTAFDVNAINSTGAGRTSLESARVTRRVTPRGDAANRVTDLEIESGVYGRGGRLTDTELPVLDPATGRFSKGFPPSDALQVEITALVPELLRGEGEVAITFDSSLTTAFDPASAVEATYHYTITTPIGSQRLAIPVRQSATTSPTFAGGRFIALEADPELAARYLAPPGAYQVEASYGLSFPSGYYGTVRSRGCVNHASGFPSFGSECAYNGPRWFHGEHETVAHPNGSNPDRFNTGLDRVEFNNVGGGLPGVATIFEPRAYDDYSNTWRDVEAVLLPYQTAADYRVYWGTGGTIDSVIDVTHDVVVPFSERIGNSWGILNRAATQNGATYLDLRSELTVTDAGCVEPLRSLNPGGIACTGQAAVLSRTAVPGPVAFGANGNTVNERLAPPRGEGFVLYLKGHLFMVELEFGTVLAGRVWTLRDYVGAISGGIGRAGDALPYSFTTQAQPRPFTAVGAAVRFRYRATNTVVASSAGTLARVRAVPDPYYGVSAGGEAPPGVTFVDLPATAVVRVYSTSGVLVRLLRHQSPSDGGDLLWDLRNRSARRVAGGVYFYHVTAENGEAAVGRLTIVNP